MFVKKLQLNNFRNYDREEYNFSPGINIIVGQNAQGKTNCVEAVFLLATGFSPRVKRDKQVVRYGQKKGEIFAEASSRIGTLSSKIEYYSDANKKVTVNGIETKKVGELLGNIFAIFFNPGELKLIQESPEDRRRFMDISISQTSKRYFYALSKYKKILEQRNNLLKDPDKDLIFDTIPIWDEQLANYAAEIIVARNDFIKRLAPHARAAHSYITDQREDLKVSLSSKYQGSQREIAEELKEGLFATLERDMILGYTTMGPHRDDLKITVNDEDVRAFGSQGQQRTAALSLKLAELEIYKEHFGEAPVLILDDALSELDKSRQKRLVRLLEGVQTIITCTHVDEEVFEGMEYKKFVVEEGTIRG